MPRMSLRDIMAVEQARSEAVAVAEAQAAADAAAEAKAAAEAAMAAEAESAARIARGEKPCWLCERDKKIIAFHKCKEKTCPQAHIAYTRFYRDGTPNTAYPAHPLRAYYSSPGMPSHSNNFYKRAFAEYDREQARAAAKTAAKIRAAEDATGLKGDEAVAEFNKLTRVPKHGLAEYLNDL